MSKYITQYNSAATPQSTDYLLLQRGSTYYKLLMDDLYTDLTSTIGGSLTLGSVDEHTDVDTTSVTPTTGNMFRFNGTNWVPSNILPALDNISDVDTTGVVSGALLKYNGTNWVDTAVADYMTNGGETAGAHRTFGNNDAFNLNFETNNTTRISILDTGEVGIGSTTDNDIDDYQFFIESSKAEVFGLRSTSGTLAEIVYSNPSSTSVRTRTVSIHFGFTDNTNGDEWGGYGIGVIGAGDESGDYQSASLYSKNLAISQIYEETGSTRIDHIGTMISDNGGTANNPIAILQVTGDDSVDTDLPIFSVGSINFPSTTTFGLFTVLGNGHIWMSELPTSSAGLSAGEIYADSGDSYRLKLKT